MELLGNSSYRKLTENPNSAAKREETETNFTKSIQKVKRNFVTKHCTKNAYSAYIVRNHDCRRRRLMTIITPIPKKVASSRRTSDLVEATVGVGRRR